MLNAMRYKIAGFLARSAQRMGGAYYTTSPWQHGNPQYLTWNVDRATKEGYQASTWVYACTRLISDQISTVPLVVWKKTGKRKVEWKQLTDHPLQLLLERPNNFMPGNDFSKARTTFMNLAGNSYWFVVEAGGRPIELWPLRPDRVAPIPDRYEYLRGYEYNLDGAVEKFDRQEIIHFKMFNPADDYLGMSPLMAAAKTIDMDNEAKDWNKHAMENRAVPPGGFFTDATLTDPQFDRSKAELNEGYSGKINARKPLFFDGGLKWQSYGMSPVEMDFIESRKFGIVEICAAFGPDPILLGYNEKSSFNNYETALRALWELTIIPHMEDICSRVNHDLTPRFGDNLWVEPDYTEVQALQRKFSDKVNDAKGLWSMGIPMNLINGRLELGMNDLGEDGDIAWVPAGVVPVEMAKEPPEPTGGDNIDDLPEDPNIDDNEEPDDDEKSINIPDDAQATHWKAFEGQRNRWYTPVANRIRKQFKTDLKAVLKASQGDIDGAEDRIRKALKKQDKQWVKLMSKADMDVVEFFGKRVLDSIKSDPSLIQKKDDVIFDVFAQEVKTWIAANVAQKIKFQTDTTMGDIISIISSVKEAAADAIETGATNKQLADEIQNLYKGFDKNRAMVIARTEVISASNAGSHFAAKQSGLKLQKLWLATPGNRTRDIHKKADGQKKEMDQPFIVGGEKLMFPGDSSMGATGKNIVQCRCTTIYRVKG